MAKNYFKKKFKRRTIRRISYSNLTKASSYIPKTLYPPMPSEFNVSLTLCQQNNYNVAAAGFASFNISGGSFLGLNGAYPPYFPALMRLYSAARIRKLHVDVQFMTIDNQAESMNIACGVLSQLDASNMQLNQDTMNRLRAVPGSSSKFLGCSAGGHDVVRFTQIVDVDRWTTSQNTTGALTRSAYDNVGAFGLFQPVQAALDGAPAVTFMYTPTQEAAFTFQVIRRITFHVTFMGLHLGQSAV